MCATAVPISVFSLRLCFFTFCLWYSIAHSFARSFFIGCSPPFFLYEFTYSVLSLPSLLALSVQFVVFSSCRLSIDLNVSGLRILISFAVSLSLHVTCDVELLLSAG